MKTVKAFKPTFLGKHYLGINYDKMVEGIESYLGDMTNCQTADKQWKCKFCPFVNGNFCILRTLVSDFKKENKK